MVRLEEQLSPEDDKMLLSSNIYFEMTKGKKEKDIISLRESVT